MKNTSFLFLGLLLLMVVACQQKKQVEEAVIEKVSSDYRTPYFEDTARVSNVLKYIAVVDSIFARSARANHNPAIAYGIVMDGKLIYSNTVGYSNVEKKIKATPQSRFRIASMTKSFTAMAILKLRDEGKLQLTHAAARYIPEMKELSYPTNDGRQITIFNLLTMSAGFPEDNPWGDRQLADSDEDLLNLVRAGISFSNNPGAQFEYSNLGYALLGKIIANVSGVPYQQYIRENILLPLEMNNSDFEFTEMPADEVAVGYRWEDEQWKPEALLKDGSYASMGGMICTIDDFAKYMNFLLAASPARNEVEKGPVKRSTAREMQQPWKFRGLAPQRRTHSGELCPATGSYGYGLGWRQDCHGVITVSHSGGLPGFGSVHQLFPELGFGVVAFSNLTYANMGAPASHVADTLIALARLQERVFPVSVALKAKQEQLMKVLPQWTADCDSLFAENFFPDKSKERWKKEVLKLLEEIGTVTDVTPMRPENLLRGTFTIQGDKGALEVFFTLTPETKPLIQQLEVWKRE